MKKDQNKKEGFNHLVYGKVPPSAVDLERAVLGQILLIESSLSEVIELLTPECFYVESHITIYKAMLSLRMKSRPVDILCVIEELRTMEELDKVGGSYYVTKITNDVVNNTNLKSHCHIILQKYIQRQTISICGKAVTDAYEDKSDGFDVLALASSRLRDINLEIQQKKGINITNVSVDVVSSLHNKAHNARNNIEDPNEVYTMFSEWDKINGSLFPGLFVVAGRPGMGKGVMMTEIICRMGKKYPVGVVNGEMTNKQLLIRIGCNLKNIDNRLWKKNAAEITDEELLQVYEAMQLAQDLKLHLDDNTYIHNIVAKIRLWVERYGIKLVMIDFLSLIKVPEEVGRYWTEVQKINYVMDVLRSLAKELDVPIMIFAQLNRELYKRGGNKEPNLSDLKGSGNIEEYAYQISFLHRPEYYGIFEDDLGESTQGLIYQIIAKHRDGKLDRLKYKFSPELSKIDDWKFEAIEGWRPMAKTTF